MKDSLKLPHIPTITRHLAANARMLEKFYAGLSDQEARRRPEPQRWSALEILRHLIDEEGEDFRTRIEYTLNRPGETWPPIDPEGWVTERKYNEQNLTDSFETFLEERQHSILWIEELTQSGGVKWDTPYEHPKLGAITARELLASWLAHDYLHMRQLMKLEYDRIESITGVADTPYAGSW
jgi:hypothetical protein